MVRRRDVLALGGFSAEHRYYIDLEMWLRLLGEGDCFVIPEAQCAFRIHGKAVSSSTQQSDFDQFERLPGAREMVASLTLAQCRFRLLKARLSTLIRCILYSVFG
jgi:hypothetical protein